MAKLPNMTDPRPPDEMLTAAEYGKKILAVQVVEVLHHHSNRFLCQATEAEIERG
jgi:hypothetical protein